MACFRFGRATDVKFEHPARAYELIWVMFCEMLRVVRDEHCAKTCFGSDVIFGEPETCVSALQLRNMDSLRWGMFKWRVVRRGQSAKQEDAAGVQMMEDGPEEFRVRDRKALNWNAAWSTMRVWFESGRCDRLQ